jgi:hypothetical protein
LVESTGTDSEFAKVTPLFTQAVARPGAGAEVGIHHRQYGRDVRQYRDRRSHGQYLAQIRMRPQDAETDLPRGWRMVAASARALINPWHSRPIPDWGADGESRRLREVLKMMRTSLMRSSTPRWRRHPRFQQTFTRVGA